MTKTPFTACRCCGHRFCRSCPHLARGRCRRCYNRMWDRRERRATVANGAERDTMTAAEVDALVAERLACLPPWWPREPKGPAREPYTIPVIRRDRRRKASSVGEGK